jgi:hypothetical protein
VYHSTESQESLGLVTSTEEEENEKRRSPHKSGTKGNLQRAVFSVNKAAGSSVKPVIRCGGLVHVACVELGESESERDSENESESDSESDVYAYSGLARVLRGGHEPDLNISPL